MLVKYQFLQLLIDAKKKSDDYKLGIIKTVESLIPHYESNPKLLDTDEYIHFKELKKSIKSAK